MDVSLVDVEASEDSELGSIVVVVAELDAVPSSISVHRPASGGALDWP